MFGQGKNEMYKILFAGMSGLWGFRGQDGWMRYFGAKLVSRRQDRGSLSQLNGCHEARAAAVTARM